MTKQKAYTVLEIGWEYNDEYMHTGNDGDTFVAPSEVFLDKEKAEAEWLKKEIDAFRGQELAMYIGEQDLSHYLVDGVSEEEFIKFIKETFDIEVDIDDYYEIYIPKTATDEQIKELINLMTLRFYKLHELTITE